MDGKSFLILLISFSIITFTSADVSNEATEEVNIKNGTQAKKTITGDKNWDAVIGAFRETIVRGFLQADALKITSLAMGHPLGMATIWMLTIIKVA